jgi:hypothetical protein
LSTSSIGPQAKSSSTVSSQRSSVAAALVVDSAQPPGSSRTIPDASSSDHGDRHDVVQQPALDLQGDCPGFLFRVVGAQAVQAVPERIDRAGPGKRQGALPQVLAVRFEERLKKSIEGRVVLRGGGHGLSR